MPKSAEELVELLDLETIDTDLFRGIQPDTMLQRVFGGQVAAQSLVAGARTVEPSEEGVEGWLELLRGFQIGGGGFLAECTPGYYNNEGNVRAMSAKNGSYGAGPVAFVKLLESWRASGELEGLNLS